MNQRQEIFLVLVLGERVSYVLRLLVGSWMLTPRHVHRVTGEASNNVSVVCGT